jgi:hypothetical protein
MSESLPKPADNSKSERLAEMRRLLDQTTALIQQKIAERDTANEAETDPNERSSYDYDDWYRDMEMNLKIALNRTLRKMNEGDVGPAEGLSDEDIEALADALQIFKIPD